MDTITYNCLVVDDEPIARTIIVNYIKKLPVLRLAAESKSAVEAIEQLRVLSTDIIFLDINMPNLSGLQLLKIIQPQQPVIFTTAYSEYAVESYELNAIDYLLKPFSFERFTKAVYKAIDAIKGEYQVPIYIKSEGKNYPVLPDDIVYCEAMKNYTMVQLMDGRKLMPLLPLSKFELLIAEAGGDLVQVHRSFLISKRHISAVTSAQVNLHQYEVPIGVQFKERFFRAIGMRDQ